jgi:O-antigen ligase
MSLARLGVFACATAVVVAVGFADGGYFRGSWLSATLAFCSLAGIVLLLRERIVLGVLDFVALAGLATFVGWTALSASWSSAPTGSLHDAQRGLIYVAALLALLLLVDSESVRELLGGAAAGVVLVSGYSFGERLFATTAIPDDPVSRTRLTEPLGYANALGILATLGVLLALGLATHARGSLERAAWAAAPPLLLSTLALTQSRGATIALAAGVAVLLLLERLRAELLSVVLVVAIPSAVAVGLTLSSHALTDAQATSTEISSAGRRLGIAVALLMAAAGLAALACDRLTSRLRGPRLSWVVPTVIALGLASVAAVAVVGVDRALGPRVDYWRVAWHEFAHNRLLGSGSSTFAESWQRTGAAITVLDAHSIYLETLAELGLLGLLLLVAAFSVPLVAAVRGREHGFAAPATSVWVAFVVHAGLDWDWEMPAVTLTALAAAVALLVASRLRGRAFALGTLERVGLGAGALSVAALAVVLRLAVE